LSVIHVFHFAHLGVVAGCRQAVSLTQDVFGMELERFLGTGFNAKGFPFTQIALERMFDIIMKEYGPEGTAGQALVAGDALLLVEPYNTVFFEDGVRWTPLSAFRDAALLAHDGHPDHWMGVENHDPHAALLGVVGALPTHTAGQFTDSASGTAFRNDGQVHAKPPVIAGILRKRVYITERRREC